MNVQNFGGFTLWKVDARDAQQHPHGTEYAGMARTPDGQLWGIHACVRELNGRKHFEGGLFPVDAYVGVGPPWDPRRDPTRPAVAAHAAAEGRAAATSMPACAESKPVHSARTGKLTDTAPQGDLVQMAEAIAGDVAEFDDSQVLEELPL